MIRPKRSAVVMTMSEIVSHLDYTVTDQSGRSYYVNVAGEHSSEGQWEAAVDRLLLGTLPIALQFAPQAEIRRGLSPTPRNQRTTRSANCGAARISAALMHTDAGEVRRIRCLEAALFALQDSRYSQLTQPTEFVANILRRDERLKI